MNPKQGKAEVNLIITEVNLSHTEAKICLGIQGDLGHNLGSWTNFWRREWLPKGTIYQVTFTFSPKKENTLSKFRLLCYAKYLERHVSHYQGSIYTQNQRILSRLTYPIKILIRLKITFQLEISY